jgi:ketosteroid isomerase-like protein
VKTNAMLAILLLLTTGTVAYASDEDTVRLRDDQERVAALKRDVPALESLWSDNFTVNAPNNQVVVGKLAVLDTFIRGGIINFSSFERDVEFLRIDGDFAIIMGSETLVPVASARAAGLIAGKKVVRRFTNIWKKEGNVWRLYWRHANVVPTGG